MRVIYTKKDGSLCAMQVAYAEYDKDDKGCPYLSLEDSYCDGGWLEVRGVTEPVCRHLVETLYDTGKLDLRRYSDVREVYPEDDEEE